MTGPSTAPGSAGSGDEPPLAPVSSTRARRVVLGLAVVLVVLVGGGAALAISTGAGRDSNDPAAGGSGVGPSAGPSAGASAPSGASPGAGAPLAGGTPAAVTPPPTPPDDAFRPVPRLCEEADFSPVFDILAQVEVLSDDEVAGPTLYQRSCTFRLEDAGSLGTFQANVSVYSSPAEAQGWFDDILTAEARGEPHQELVGDWDANAVLAVAGGRDQAEVRFMARDETLVLNLSTFIIGDAADEEAQQAAVVEIAAQLRDGIRA